MAKRPDPAADWQSTRALQAECLQLRGYLFDPVTRLPSLGAVLDDIRRRLETGERLFLVYLDLSSAGHAEAVGGWQTHDRWLGRAVEVIEACRGDLFESGGIVAQLGVRSDELVVVLGDGDGASSLPERLLRRLLTAQRQDDELHAVPSPQTSGVGLEPRPRFRLERAIYGAVARARERCRQEIERRHSLQLDELQRLLRSGDIVVRYQPIIDLGDRRIHGFEALSAAPPGSVFENPEMLFTFAEEHSDVVSLERVCRRQAVARSTALPAAADGAKLFLNCSPLAFQDPQLLDGLLGTGLESRLVLEVTERVAVTEWRSFRRALKKVRDAGLAIALDDVGSGYSSLQAIGEIEPDYLKFDFSLIHRLHESPIKRQLVRTLGDLARSIGARSIAEGIEVEDELGVVRDLGVDFGQGFFLGRPAEPTQLQIPT
ncbi:MAG: EAL domain-containing protein [Acidobacteriota bacterium]